jgi:translation initiation factor 3 subunit B
VDRWVGKSKITYYTCFEVFGFDAEKKDVTFIETLELKDKVVSGISWEPQGKRFVLCYKNMEQNGGGAGGAVSTVNSLFSLYEYDSSAVVGSQVKLVKSLSRSKNLDTMLWSPKGRVLLLAASNGEGLLEFWNVPRDAASSSMELMASQEHYLMSSVMWDPSGRYVTSIAQAKSRSSSETGYTIYDFKGLAIEKVSVPHLKQCLWRPRLPLLLSNSQLKKIRKDLAKYSTIFTEQDQSRKNKANLATSMHLLKMQEEWATWAKAWKKQLAEEMPERNLLLFGDRAGGAVRMEEEFEDIQEIVEELLEETIEDAPEE